MPRLGLKWGGPRKNTRPIRLSYEQLSNVPPWADCRPNLHVGHGFDVFDQGDEGSCVGNGTAAAVFAALVLCGEKDLFIPSRQGIYDKARELDGDFAYDNGTSISQAMNAVQLVGVWPENKPDDPANEPYPGTFAPVHASAASLAFGEEHQALQMRHVDQTALVIKAVIASGIPVLMGWQVYGEDMDLASRAGTGVMPRNPGGDLDGGHCGLICTYNDTTLPQAAPGFEFAPTPPGLAGNLNSWSNKTGCHGYLFFPQSRVLSPDFMDDFGAIPAIEIG